MLDESVDISSVRRIFIPDIFLPQYCQHSFHNCLASYQHIYIHTSTHIDTHTQTHIHIQRHTQLQQY